MKEQNECKKLGVSFFILLSVFLSMILLLGYSPAVFADEPEEETKFSVTFYPNGAKIAQFDENGNYIGLDSKPTTQYFNYGEQLGLLNYDYPGKVFTGLKVLSGSMVGQIINPALVGPGKIYVTEDFEVEYQWIKEGWNKEGDKWFYVQEGDKYRGFLSVSGKMYYLGDDYYMKTGWIQDGEAWYYADDTGVLASGWKKIGRNWYYFDPIYLDMRRGMVQINGKNYFFNENGPLQTGWIDAGGDWYYADENGLLATGWKEINGKWYYFYPENGIMATNLVTIKDKLYFFGDNGVMRTGWVKCGNYWYLFDANGVATIGWKKLKNDWYYFKNDGRMCVGSCYINDKEYLFGDDGKMGKYPGWVLMSGSWYFLKSDGTIYSGLLKHNGSWYYLEGGVMQTGWTTDLNNWFYAEKDGKFAIGWKQINGKNYFFSTHGELVKGWFYSNGKYYYADTDGNLLTGWQTIDGHKYCFGSSGQMTTCADDVYIVRFDAGTESVCSSYWGQYLQCCVEMVPKGSEIGRAVPVDSDSKMFYYWKDEAGKLYTERDGGFIIPKKNMVLTAIWKDPPLITMDPNGGTISVLLGLDDYETHSEKFSFRLLHYDNEFDDPVKEGYIFTGWYVVSGTGAGSVVYTLSNDGFHPVKDTELKAMYSKIGWNKIDGKWYYIGDDGNTARQMKKIDGKWYYFGDDGIMRTGWQQTPNGWYYFKSDGSSASREWINGYWFEENGLWGYTGRGKWTKKNGKWTFGDNLGWMAKTAWQKIDGKWYYFDSNGYMVTGTRTIAGKVYKFDTSGACTNRDAK